MRRARRGLVLTGCVLVAACGSPARSATPPQTTSAVTSTSIATTSTSVPATTTSSSSTSTTTPSTTSTSTTTTSTTSSVPTDDDFDRLDRSVLAATLGDDDLAVSIAVVDGDRVLHTRAVGDGVEVNPGTRFRLASISKVLTAIVVMQLVEEGAIDLDEPFARQLGVEGPVADARVRTITVRQLLSHMSGMPVLQDAFFGGGATSWRAAALIGLASTLSSDPGSEFAYSNVNYCLLGLLIEHVTGGDYEAAVVERLGEPLGLSGLRLAGTFDSGVDDAPYRSEIGRTYMEALGPAGAWVATATDVARLLESLDVDNDGWHPLREASVRAMRTAQPAVLPSPEWTYGLGLRLFTGGEWGHTGTVEQTRDIVVTLPSGPTVAVFVSGDAPWTGGDLLELITL